jgi:hypothetical protein
MAKTMTPSASAPKTTTEGQITKAVALYRALLEKHASEFDSEVVQAVLGEPSLAREMLSLFRERVEVRMGEIVRRVKVDRTLKPRQVIDATGRTKYVDQGVAKTMPMGEGDEVNVVFFKPRPNEYTRPGFMSNDDLRKALDRRVLTPDPRAQAKANEEDPAFADEHPNGTHWKDGDSYNFVAFDRWDGERNVDVHRDLGEWDDHWWFAGVRK